MQQPENLLVVFFGMIATGKSYLASAWANQYGLPYYNSDRIRKELAGIVPTASQKEEVGGGIYSPEFSRRTYDALIEKAASHFKADTQASVILDGSYQSLAERDLLRKQLADQAKIVFIHCFCSEKVVQERLEIRASDPNAVSDGNWNIYLSQKERAKPVLDSEQVIEIDTDSPVDELVKRVTEKINH
ncbi:MAG: AAA family ATPase [Desulfocapsa sp.]|nr:AAA family ATPase [Desulfocapsa sp.]